MAAGSGTLTGFPTIWAQNIEDVKLIHAGPPVAAIPQIGAVPLTEQRARLCNLPASRTLLKEGNLESSLVLGP